MKLSRQGILKGTGAGAMFIYLGVLYLWRNEETMSLFGIRWRHEPTNQSPTVVGRREGEVDEKEELSLGAFVQLTQLPLCTDRVS